MTLSITCQRTTNQSVVLILHGEIDHAGAADLRAAISSATARQPRPPTIVVDLSQVQVVDALGVGTLVVGHRICQQIGIDLAVRNPSPLIRGLLGMAGKQRHNRPTPAAGRATQTKARVGSTGSR